MNEKLSMELELSNKSSFFWETANNIFERNRAYHDFGLCFSLEFDVRTFFLQSLLVIDVIV